MSCIYDFKGAKGLAGLTECSKSVLGTQKVKSVVECSGSIIEDI